MEHYYVADKTHPKGFVEVTEAEFVAIMGDDTTRPYVNKVYSGAMTIDEVPEERRETVYNIVQNKIARFGTYESHDIPDSEALNIITGGGTV